MFSVGIAYGQPIKGDQGDPGLQGFPGKSGIDGLPGQKGDEGAPIIIFNNIGLFLCPCCN